MARGSSKSSGSTRNRQGGSGRGSRSKAKGDTTAAETVEPTTDSVTVAGDETPSATETIEAGTADSTPSEATAAIEDGPAAETPAETGDDTLGSAGDDSVTGADSTESGGDIDTVETDGDETVTLGPEGESSTALETTGDDTGETGAPETSTRPEPAPTVPPPAPEPARRGGFVPLLLGGVVAAGIGYGAAYMGWLPTGGQTEAQSTAIAEALEAQSAALSDLQNRVTALAEAEQTAPEMPEVDFSPVLERIEALSGRIDSTAGSIETLAERVTVLEERPVFTGNVDADTAAAAEAAAELEAELAAQREAAEARAAELQAAAAEAEAAAEQAAAEAAEAVAEAEAEAAEATARAEADAALNAVRVAFETGAPFAEPLQTVSAAAEVPAALSEVAESGVATMEELQASFPPLAREALPVALQETAGEGVGDRLGAFVMGQIGGRSVEPREGDDPDAVLSRVEAAVRNGELQAALSEIEALPEGAQEVLAPWVADVEARAAAEDGLETLTAALSANGN